MAAIENLTVNQKAYVQHLAKAGDIIAKTALDALDNTNNLGRAALVAGGTPAAKGTTNVHVAVFGDAVGPVTVSTGLTNPDVARNVRLPFGSTYDGGNVTVVGTDQYGAAVSEVIVAVANTTVVGVKVFKTVTSFSYAGGGVGTHGTNTVSVGTGDKIGVTPKPVAASPVQETVDGVGEATVFDFTYNGFTPTTVPNGSHVYILTFNQ